MNPNTNALKNAKEAGKVLTDYTQALQLQKNYEGEIERINKNPGILMEGGSDNLLERVQRMCGDHAAFVLTLEAKVRAKSAFVVEKRPEIDVLVQLKAKYPDWGNNVRMVPLTEMAASYVQSLESVPQWILAGEALKKAKKNGESTSSN